MTGFKKIIYILIFTVCIFALAGCTGANSDKIRLSDKDILAQADAATQDIFVSDANAGEMIKLASSGMLDLFLDDKSMSVCVYDNMTQSLYRALPEKYEGEKADVLRVHALIEGREYVLSSQNDSLAFGCTEYKITSEGVVITYNFRQSLKNNKKLDITVPVEFVLTDGMLSVRTHCSKIINNSKGRIEIQGIEVLPFFAADTVTAKGDYILLPDGCGALLDLGKKTDAFDELSLEVYGSDAPVLSGEQAQVLIGAFGRKRGNGAFVCLVSEGDAMCTIKADKASSEGGYNRVGAYFCLTPTLKDERSIFVSGESYQGIAELSYRFLSGENACYTGMASAARELLIRQGKLREKAIDEAQGYPFNLTLVMSEQVVDEKGKESSRALSSFAQSSELISSLMTKGFEGVNVRLKGVYEKGSVSVDSSLGSKKDFEGFVNVTAQENIRIYADASFAETGGACARKISGKRTELSSVRSINKNLSTIISELRDQPFYGVCINDKGASLYSDYTSGRTMLRSDVRNSLSDIIASVGASKALMIEKGNLYSIKYAQGILNIPSESSVSENENFRDVPFIQIILHGIADYSLSAANLSGNSTYAMLKAAEYGALPHYEWTCTSSSAESEEDAYYYMNSLGEAKAYYDKFRNDFSSVRDRRITEHKMIKEGVYVTYFGEELKVYVNYTDESVNISGVNVYAGSYTAVG